jgi:hypothetical protein
LQIHNGEDVVDEGPLLDTYQTMLSAQFAGGNATSTRHHTAPSRKQTCPKGWIDWGRYYRPSRPSPLLEDPFERSGQATTSRPSEEQTVSSR